MSFGPRLEKLRQGLNEKKVDGVLISSPENRRYLSGFAGSAGYLLITETEAVLVTDFRYIEQAKEQAPDYEIERIAHKSDWLPKLVARIGISKVGFESEHLTVATHSALEKALGESRHAEGASLIDLSDTIDVIRATKSEDEMKSLTRAVEITDQAFDEVAAGIEPGVTEAEVAWALEKAMRDRGAEASAFDIIVGAGPNGALPHHRADETVIRDGDPVVIDMGATYEGYNADLTRTIVVGEPDETFRSVYDTVLKAQLVAEEMVEPGMTGGEVDAIARDVIGEAGPLGRLRP